MVIFWPALRPIWAMNAARFSSSFAASPCRCSYFGRRPHGAGPRGNREQASEPARAGARAGDSSHRHVLLSARGTKKQQTFRYIHKSSSKAETSPTGRPSSTEDRKSRHCPMHLKLPRFKPLRPSRSPTVQYIRATNRQMNISTLQVGDTTHTRYVHRNKEGKVFVFLRRQIPLVNRLARGRW